MAANALPLRQERELPDLLPARMVNEYVYCPRLFYYEWVEGVFRESADTLEGAWQHRRVDQKGGAELPAPEELGGAEKIHSRSVALSSQKYRVTAKLDLLEVDGGTVTPVDYKHGRPREVDGSLVAWPADRVQLAVQALVLRENGYPCEEGLIYYAKTKQRVRVAFDEAAMEEALEAIAGAFRTALLPVIPAPLVDSPKCPGCSLAPVCLPDETLRMQEERGEAGEQLSLFEREDGGVLRKGPRPGIRQMMTPRDEKKPLYLNTQGLRVGKSGQVLQVKENDSVRQEVRIGEINQVSLLGNIQISTQAVQTLCEAEVPVCYFSMGGWFYGITSGMVTKNVMLRKAQFRLSEEEWFRLRLARRLVAGKIRNQRTMLLRNHVEPDERVLRELKEHAGKAEEAGSIESLMGVEGNAARLYFGQFAGMLKNEDGGEAGLVFDFDGRNRRPPRDPVNALLSLGYSLLAKDLTVTCYAVGFDPLVGFYHALRHGRPALALDLMEPFRPLVVDSAVIQAVNTRMVGGKHFVTSGGSVALTAEGRKAFFRAYELRMDGLVTHPLFEYRVSYRRLLEVQTRMLARVMEGEIGEYPVFVTR